MREVETMYWNEDPPPEETRVPDDIVDVLFAIDCRQLPVDHAHALSNALQQALPWLADTPGLGIHTIHGAGSQNGWERPQHDTRSCLQISRRTKLTLRASKAQAETLLRTLPGLTLDIAGHALTLGQGKTRPLSKDPTLFARHVVTTPGEDEARFLATAAETLASIDIRLRKALCGRSTALTTPDGAILTRSLMLASLTPDESIRLQQRGLGPHRLMGCGIFIPHKGIDPVRA